MERRVLGVCFALLWGYMLGAATAQGKEGECVRGGRPGSGAAGFPDLGASRSPARLESAQLWRPTWRRPVPEHWGWEGARAAIGTNLGTPPTPEF